MSLGDGETIDIAGLPLGTNASEDGDLHLHRCLTASVVIAGIGDEVQTMTNPTRNTTRRSGDEPDDHRRTIDIDTKRTVHVADSVMESHPLIAKSIVGSENDLEGDEVRLRPRNDRRRLGLPVS